MFMSRSIQVLAVFSVASLSGCGGRGNSDETTAPSPPPPAATYSIGGVLSGLTGGTVLLRLNGGGELALSTNGAFTFVGTQSSGFAYTVAVAAQPAGHTCSVTNSSGTVISADVTHVTVACQADSSGGGETSLRRLSRLRYDLDNNGVIDAERVFSYDAEGRVMGEQYTYAGDAETDTDFGSFSIDAPPRDQSAAYIYDGAGLLQSWSITDESGERVDNRYEYGADILADRYSIEVFDAQGGLTSSLDFVLTYADAQLTGWENFVNPSTLIQSDELNYDASGRVQSDLLTMAIGGGQTHTAYAYTASGRIDSVRQSDPAPGSTFFFQADYGYDGQGSLTDVVFTGSAARDNYTWSYTIDGDGLRTQWRIDLGSNQTVEAVIHVEWEAGPCHRVFLWAPRAHPNFVAGTDIPYAPGSGYAVLPACGP